jgi:GT2 family glycosyltransferase
MFDIIVPTYNRYHALPDFFKKIEILDRSLYTLWLIDDCSSQKDVSVIPKWDNIKFIELPQNIGQAGARNYAITHGRAPYIISLDDDAWFMPESKDLNVISQAFSKYSDAGCLMFNIATPKTTFKPDTDGMLLPLHVTCGCAYRREALEAINGFNSLIQGQGEESDISLKLYKANCTIRSLYTVHVYHDFNPDIRTVEWYLKIRHRETRNCLIVAFIHYPLLSLFWAIPGKAGSQLIYAIKKRMPFGSSFVVTLKAVGDFLKMVPGLIKWRKPLTTAQFKQWRTLYKTAD